jgi:hypothetical protein
LIREENLSDEDLKKIIYLKNRKEILQNLQKKLKEDEYEKSGLIMRNKIISNILSNYFTNLLSHGKETIQHFPNEHKPEIDDQDVTLSNHDDEEISVKNKNNRNPNHPRSVVRKGRVEKKITDCLHIERKHYAKVNTIIKIEYVL